MKRFLRRTMIRRDPARDVGDELRFHIDMRAQEFVDAGMSPDEARRAASDVFGDVAAIDAQLRIARRFRDEQAARRDRWHDFTADVAFALRTLRKNAAFTAAALATLTLGIGATIAVFTVMSGVLLRPLPYANPDRLGMIWLSSKQDLGSQMPVSSGFYSDIAQSTTSFSSTAAFRSWGYTLTSAGEAEQVAGARVTPSLFPILGVRPELGRWFAATDGEEGAAPVVLLSHQLWQRRYGGSTSIVGRSIELGGKPFTVIGVMPVGFAFPRGAELPSGMQFGTRTELWTPLSFSERDTRNYQVQNLAAIGRLKPGTTASSAAAEISAQLHRFLATVAPGLKLDYNVIDLQQQAGGGVRRGLLLLMGAVTFVLFIACANVTNLLVARTSSRRRELAVRAALGAARWRIARQLITENVVLATMGTVIGIAFSIWVTRIMLRLVPGSLPRVDDVSVDWRVAAGAGAIALFVGVVFGLISTAQVRWGTLVTALHEAGARSSGGRATRSGRRALVVAEVSLSLMLVIGAALFMLSFARLQRVQPGFVAEGKLTAAVSLPISSGLDPKRDGPNWASFFSQVNARLASSPGIRAVGAVSSLPLSGAVEGGSLSIGGQPQPAPGKSPHAQYSVVEGDYFRAAGIRLVSGRVFDATDVATSTPVIVVNREFVRRHLNGLSPLATQIACGCDFSNGTMRSIIGVVDDVRQMGLDATPEPQIYFTESQMPYPSLHFVIRAAGDPMSALAIVKREVKAVDPHLAVADVRTFSDVVDESLARQRFAMTVVAIFAGAALLLALVGLYGVIALSVGQRQREIGVRVALGARGRDVLRLVLGEGIRIGAIGTAIGLVGALAVSRVVQSVLFDVSPTNAVVYALATVSIAAITLLASWLPARRAARVDPTVALRSD